MISQLDGVYRSQRLRLSATVAAQAARIWATSEPRDKDAFVERTVPVVEAGQSRAVRLVDAYMATKMIGATGDGAVKGLDESAYTVERLRGVPADEVYRRPFAAMAVALASGAKFAAARTAGMAALEKLVTTDLQLAQTHSSRDWMSDEPGIVGYRRVTAGGCGLCLAASTQRYHVADLMPIHEHCRCGVDPIFGDRPVGRVLDPETWSVVKDAAEGDLSAKSLSRLRAENLDLPDVLRVRRDAELGLRLVDEKWAA